MQPPLRCCLQFFFLLLFFLFYHLLFISFTLLRVFFLPLFFLNLLFTFSVYIRTSAMNGTDSGPSTPTKTIPGALPVKVGGPFVGRLSLLQESTESSNIAAILAGQEQIRDQIHRLEAQTAQTGVDLNQLVDRLKNNNSYLTKLLEGVSGGVESDVLGATEAVRLAVEELRESIELTFAQIGNQRHNHLEQMRLLTSEIEKQLALLQQYGQKDENRDQNCKEVNQEAISGQVAASTVEIREKLLADREKALLEREMAIETQRKAIDDREFRLQERERLIQQQQLDIKGLSEQLAELKTASMKDEQKKSIDSLEITYKKLSDAYSTKYEDYKHLKEEYDDLLELIEQAAPREAAPIKLRKMHELHTQAMGHIKAEIAHDRKRIVSTPLGKIQ